MKKKKIINKKECISRYAESALISAIRLRRYWISQGYSDNEAIKRAVKQASGMMASSRVPLDELLELFQEMKGASDAFVEMIKKAMEETEKKRRSENFAKEITLKRIKGIWETYIGDPEKRISISQIVGQATSAIKNKILTKEEIKRIGEGIKKEIKENKLYPFSPLSKERKLKRYYEILKKLEEK